jgi:lipopolysaccharide/colanic/teichoic acid biosynthesis glycosyltransferase
MKEIADTPDYRRRLSVRPGLTGLVQVHGRAWFFRYGRKRAFRLDAFYAARHSALLDIIILLQTVLVVLKGKGV